MYTYMYIGVYTIMLTYISYVRTRVYRHRVFVVGLRALRSGGL